MSNVLLFPEGVRLGAVPYLNALPLISIFSGTVETAVPSQLAMRYELGALDAALLPIYQLLQHDSPQIADSISISSHGTVFSVYLAHKESLADIKRVHLDPDSYTSNALIRCLCAEFLNWSPEFSSEQPGPNDAKILIGDPAINFRISPPEGWNFLDLGEEWTRHTHLPFVYAVWGIRSNKAVQIAEFLRSAKQIGMTHIDEIAAKDCRPDFAKTYLGGYIRYDLNDSEKRAISLFAELLYKYNLSPVFSRPTFI